MVSVGIMSMQRIHNYGSTLQAYGMRRLIEETVPDASVSFLDFRPGDAISSDPGDPETRMGQLLTKVRQYNSLHVRLIDRLRFLDHKRAYGKRYLPLIGIPRSANLNFAVDCQVIGSDEVFNCIQTNPNVGYSRDLFGHDSPARRVISYAASFGNTTLPKIRAAKIVDEVAEDLNHLCMLILPLHMISYLIHAFLRSGFKPSHTSSFMVILAG
jgi:hypothetical protein